MNVKRILLAASVAILTTACGGGHHGPDAGGGFDAGADAEGEPTDAGAGRTCGASVLSGSWPSEARTLEPGDAESIALADLDGDGDLDIASVSSNRLAVQRNDGYDQFSVAYSFGLFLGESVAVFDADEDGDLDLTVVDEDGPEPILLFANDGAGGFPSAPEALPSTVIGPEMVVAGDLDGAPPWDIVVAFNGDDGTGTDPGGIAVLYRDGREVEEVVFRVGSDPESAALADLDADGWLDVAAANEADANVSVLLNDQRRSFAEPTSFAVGRDPESIAAGDLDGDGDADLVVANGFLDAKGLLVDDTISILENDGTAGFTAAAQLPVGVDPFFVLLADLDQDRDLDIATANQGGWVTPLEHESGGVSLLQNRGGLSFAPATDLAFEGASVVAAGDVDGDTLPDLVVGNVDPGEDSDGWMTLLATACQCGNGVPTGGEVCDDGNAVEGDGCDSNCTPSACRNGVVAGDEACDDGNADDADGCDTNCTRTACGNGVHTTGEFCDDGNTAAGDACAPDCLPPSCRNGVWEPGDFCFEDTTDALPVAPGPIDVAAADLDADGNVDLVTVSHSTATVSVLLNQGARSFLDAVETTVDGVWSVATGDLDGDGDPDVATGGLSLTVLANDGAGGLTSMASIPLVPGGKVVCADLDGDGIFDVAGTDDGGNVAVVLSLGGGDFAPAQRTFAGDPMFGVVALTVIDVDGDGDPDLAAIANGQLVVLRNDGLGGLGPVESYANEPGFVGEFLGALAAGDLDNDGDEDLLASGQGLLLLRNDGNGTFSPRLMPSPASGGGPLLVGHVDDDRRLDAVAGGVGGDQSIHPGSADGLTAAPLWFGVFSAQTLLVDLDGDEAPDLVTTDYNGDPGRVEVRWAEP